jgi:hypothetical protein
MANRNFSEAAQLAGVRKSLASLRDAKKRGLRGKPVWLIGSLEKRERELAERVEGPSKSRPSGKFFDGLRSASARVLRGSRK